MENETLILISTSSFFSILGCIAFTLSITWLGCLAYTCALIGNAYVIYILIFKNNNGINYSWSS